MSSPKEPAALGQGESLRLVNARPAPSWAMIVLGYACIIAGGGIAAIAGPLEMASGSWAAAYLVLVGGIGQLALGWVPGVLGRSDAADTGGWIPVLAWNVGNALVLLGTFIDQPLGVDAGSVLLIITLIMALGQMRGWRKADIADRITSLGSRLLRLLGWAYLVVLIILIVSIPVGIALAHIRQ